MRKSSLASLALLACCGTSLAETTMPSLEGEYKLSSSTTVPKSNWGFSKGHLSVQKLDDRHLAILFACEWKREPKAVCDEHYFAQWRDGGLYMQDMNTDFLRVYFDPATRTITMIRRGADDKASVRRDIFAPAGTGPEDATLARRLKRTEKNSTHPESLRVFGPYSKWKYENNRIEFQNTTP